MGIINRNLKRYEFKEEGFPYKLTLTWDEGKKGFYFSQCYYMDDEKDEIFISYKALPWSEEKREK